MPWILSAFADEASQSVDEQIRALKEAQINHVDLRNVDGTNIVELPIDHAKQVREKLDAAGISVCMYGSPIGKIDLADDFDIDRNRLKHLGKLGPILGGTYVRIFSFYNKDANLSDGDRTAKTIEQLSELAQIAADNGLTLYHENEIDIYGDDPGRVQILRDEVHAKHPDSFKLIFDFDNYNQMGADVYETWQTLGPDAHAIHIKESKKMPDGSFMHVPAGEGDGYIPKILAELAASDWDGPLTLEPHLARSPAVLATGAHGTANASLADLDDYQCFQVAAVAARKIIGDVGKL